MFVNLIRTLSAQAILLTQLLVYMQVWPEGSVK